MLSCNNVVLKINDQILFSIGFTLFSGSVVYLRGANGSGKSSLLRIISGIQAPSQGEVLFCGKPISTLDKPYANYIGHNIGIKDELTVLENLAIWSRLYNSSIALPSSIHYFGLAEILHDKAYTLSKGNRQKVALARLLSCASDLWLLDEVETHLDDKNQALLNNLISVKANNGGIIIICSHLESKIKNAIEIEMGDFSG
ncbi:MAG: heme ABC exporter ATP-binding protein CcmA [Pseudomonadota bacterium]